MKGKNDNESRITFFSFIHSFFKNIKVNWQQGELLCSRASFVQRIQIPPLYAVCVCKKLMCDENVECIFIMSEEKFCLEHLKIEFCWLQRLV